MADLFDDYLSGAPGLRAFFTHAPEAVDSLAQDAPVWNETMRAALLEQQTSVGLDRDIPRDAAVIATGQQPGLFTGPMYTIAKAATAVLLAARVSANSGRSCVPLFWVGADDDDFEEVATAHLLTKRNERRALRYEPSVDVKSVPLYRVPLSPTLHELIDAMATEAPGSEHTAEVAGMLHRTLDEAASFSDWFSRILAWLFAETPLLIYQPNCMAARRIATDIIAREIQTPLETTRLINETGAALERLGYVAQLVKRPNECNFFIEVDGRRCKVLHDNGFFYLVQGNSATSPPPYPPACGEEKNELACLQDDCIDPPRMRGGRGGKINEANQALTENDLLTLLNCAPECFLPNVALRCVVQQALFPVAAYVAGPGEIAYWAQLGPVFRHFGVSMPVVFPRARCVVTTPKLRQLLDKYGMNIGDLDAPEETLLDRALAATVKSPALDALRNYRGSIAREYDALLGALAGAGPRARVSYDMACNAAGEAAENLERIERAAAGEDVAQTEAVQKQVARLREALLPDRKPQERVYCVFSFLFAQGREFLPRLFEAIRLDSFGINEVKL